MFLRKKKNPERIFPSNESFLISAWNFVINWPVKVKQRDFTEWHPSVVMQILPPPLSPPSYCCWHSVADKPCRSSQPNCRNNFCSLFKFHSSLLTNVLHRNYRKQKLTIVMWSCFTHEIIFGHLPFTFGRQFSQQRNRMFTFHVLGRLRKIHRLTTFRLVLLGILKEENFLCHF